MGVWLTAALSTLLDTQRFLVISGMLGYLTGEMFFQDRGTAGVLGVRCEY